MAGLLNLLTRKHEPSPRYHHLSASCRGKIFLWGGVTKDFIQNRGRRGSIMEIFDPFLERWEQQPTTGIPPLGLYAGACSSLMDSLYAFGGFDGSRRHSSLHQMSTSVMEWRELWEIDPQDGPMRKNGCGMVPYHNDTLALFGGHGIPGDTIQPGSSFIKNESFSDGGGWTNEFHLFNVNEGNVFVHFTILCTAD